MINSCTAMQLDLSTQTGSATIRVLAPSEGTEFCTMVIEDGPEVDVSPISADAPPSRISEIVRQTYDLLFPGDPQKDQDPDHGWLHRQHIKTFLTTALTTLRGLE